MTTTFGTAAVANIFLVAGLAQPPTVSPLLEVNKVAVRPIVSKTSQPIRSVNNGSVANVDVPESLVRETTPQELLVGELRNWALLNKNWDGEGAEKPIIASLRGAEAFSRLLRTDAQEPEPMLLASGRAALLWNGGGLYADLEFLGRDQVAYYVKRNGDKHKGVVSFGSEKMPDVLQALLSV